MKFADDHGMELLQLQALFTSETFLTFVGLLPLTEEIENLQIVCFFRSFLSNLSFENGSVISLTRKRREYCSGFSILIGCFILGLFDPLFSLAYFSVSPPNSPLVLAKYATMPDKRQRDNTRALAFIRWEDWENNCFVLKVTRFFCFCSWCEAMFCNMIPHWGECHFSRFISFSSG